MDISKEQVEASIKILQEQIANDTTHSFEYKTAIDALNAVCKIKDVIAELEKRDKENWDRSNSTYCWGASSAYEASATLVKMIFN